MTATMAADADLEAFILLTLPSASLTTPSGAYTGTLALEYAAARSASPPAPDFFLVLRIDSYETVLDPAHAVAPSVLASGEHRYVLRSTSDTSDLILTTPLPTHEKVFDDDVEMLHSILAEYGTSTTVGGIELPQPETTKLFVDAPVPDADLRGRFLLVNEDSHEVVGALDESVRVHEDPVIYEKGHERDPVVVELPDRAGADFEELAETEVMVRAIPSEDRGWMINGAMFASHVISGTTTLLTSAMDAASSFYVAHSTPSPHASPSPSGTGTGTGTPLPPPSRTMLLLQSPTTRKNLTRIHTLTGHAVTLSSKAVGMVNDAIDRAVGANKGKATKSGKSPVLPPRTSLTVSSLLRPTADGKTPPPLPARSRSPSPSRAPAPPPYSPSPLSDDKRSLSAQDQKPALPPRRSPIPSPIPSPSRTPIHLPSPSPSTSASTSAPPPPLPPNKPSTKARLALSASLVLTSLAVSAQRLVAGGGDALSAAVTHKYGADAGANVRVAAGSARNVVLVYVDVRGMGRRAVVKRAVKGFAKGTMRREMGAATK